MIESILLWFNKVARYGSNLNYDTDVYRRIIFSNIVYMSLPVVYTIFMLIDYDSYLVPIQTLHFDQFIVPIVILVCIFCSYLNYRGQVITSRVLFICLWPLLLHILPIKLLHTPSDYYLAYPFGLVFHSILIQLMFSYRKEQMIFFSLLLFNIIAMIMAPATLSFFDYDQDIPKGLIDYRYYLLDIVLYWLLFNLVTFYTLYSIEGFIQRINNSKLLIENQKRELNDLNKNLESIIHERTKTLEEQNEKLKQHAFFNAHLLRGPFCRIQGLMLLQETPGIEDSEQLIIREKLKESVSELDNRIREIQKLVE